MTPQNSDRKVLQANHHAFGLDEKFFTPEHEREKAKNKFNNFIKKLEVEIKLTDKYLKDR